MHINPGRILPWSRRKWQINNFYGGLASIVMRVFCSSFFSSLSSKFNQIYVLSYSKIITMIFTHRKVIAVMEFAMLCTVTLPMNRSVLLTLHIEPSTGPHADPRSGAIMVTVATTQELQSFQIKTVKLTQSSFSTRRNFWQYLSNPGQSRCKWK